jgi:hypothetical protein
MASSEYGQGFSAGAKEQLYSTIELFEDYKKELHDDGQIARAKTVQYCIHMLRGEYP